MGLLLHSFSSKHGLETIPVIYTILYFCSGRSVDISVGKIFGPNQLISDAGMCCKHGKPLHRTIAAVQEA